MNYSVFFHKHRWVLLTFCWFAHIPPIKSLSFINNSKNEFSHATRAPKLSRLNFCIKFVNKKVYQQIMKEIDCNEQLSSRHILVCTYVFFSHCTNIFAFPSYFNNNSSIRRTNTLDIKSQWTFVHFKLYARTQRKISTLSMVPFHAMQRFNIMRCVLVHCIFEPIDISLQFSALSKLFSCNRDQLYRCSAKLKEQ